MNQTALRRLYSDGNGGGVPGARRRCRQGQQSFAVVDIVSGVGRVRIAARVVWGGTYDRQGQRRIEEQLSGEFERLGS